MNEGQNVTIFIQGVFDNVQAVIVAPCNDKKDKYFVKIGDETESQAISTKYITKV